MDTADGEWVDCWGFGVGDGGEKPAGDKGRVASGERAYIVAVAVRVISEKTDKFIQCLILRVHDSVVVLNPSRLITPV